MKEPITALTREKKLQTDYSSDTITIKIVANDRGNPVGKLAEAECTSAATRLSSV